MARRKAASYVRDGDSDLGLSFILNGCHLEEDDRTSVNSSRGYRSVRGQPRTPARAYPLTLERPLGETTTPGSCILTRISSATNGRSSARPSVIRPQPVYHSSIITCEDDEDSEDESHTKTSHRYRAGTSDGKSSTRSSVSSNRRPPVTCTRQPRSQPTYHSSSKQSSTVESWLARNDVVLNPYEDDEEDSDEESGEESEDESEEESGEEREDDQYHRSVSEYSAPVPRSRTARYKSVKAAEFEAGPAGDQDVKALPGIGAVTAANLAADHGFTKAKQLVCHYVTVCKESKTEFKKFLRTVGANSQNQELCYQAVHKCAQEYM